MGKQEQDVLVVKPQIIRKSHQQLGFVGVENLSPHLLCLVHQKAQGLIFFQQSGQLLCCVIRQFVRVGKRHDRLDGRRVRLPFRLFSGSRFFERLRQITVLPAAQDVRVLPEAQDITD